MAQRFLALDWDQQLHVVQVTISGNTVRFQRAILLDENTTPNVGEAEALGQLLKQRLKDAGMVSAPVLACIGRDRLILKEVRYPVVPEHEEPAVVKFQAVKELHDTTADDVVIDYLPTGEANGERRSQVFIVRRELVMAYHTLCQAAGLKLAGLAPRPLGMAACLQNAIVTTGRIAPPDPPDAAVALVTVGEKWAEFCILRQGRVLQTRSLTLGPTLAGEIRRNLAVHSGQGAHDPVKAVYLALSGQQASLRERLSEWLDVPVHAFDPFGGAEAPELPSQGRGTFAGAVGLCYLWAQRRELPVNFASIKMARPPKNPNQRAVLLGALLVLVLLGGGVLIGRSAVDDAQAERDELETAAADSTIELARAKKSVQVQEELHNWGGGFNWTDHFATVVQNLPKPTPAFRVQKLDGKVLPPPAKAASAKAKDGEPKTLEALAESPTAEMRFFFDAPNRVPLSEFDTALRAVRGTAESGRANKIVYDPKKDTQEKKLTFQTVIDIWRRPLSELSATPPAKK